MPGPGNLFVFAYLVLLTASSAEARHWRWHGSSRHFVVPPYAYGFAPGDNDVRRGRQGPEGLSFSPPTRTGTESGFSPLMVRPGSPFILFQWRVNRLRDTCSRSLLPRTRR